MNKNLKERLQDKSAILSVLGHYMNNPSELKKVPLEKEDLVDELPRLLLSVMKDMVNAGFEKIDETSIELFLKNNNDFKYNKYKQFGDIGNKYIGQAIFLDDVYPSNFKANYNSVKKWSIIRDTLEKGYNVFDLVPNPDFYSDDDDVKNEQFAQMTPQDVIEFFEQRNKNQILSIKEKNSSCYNSVFARYKGNNLPYSEPKEPLIEGFMLQNTMNSVIAPAKAGKSFFSYQMAHAVQNGYEFLGRKTHKTDVLYIDFELRNDAISTRCANVNKNYGGEGEYFDVIPLASTWGTDTVSLDRLVEEIKEAKKENPNLGLVIFDCYYRFAEGEENSADDVKATLGKLKTLTGNMTVVYVHHTNKRPTDIDIDKLDSGTVLIQASGSVVHSRAVDQTYYIYNTADGNYVFNTGRDWYDDVLVCTRNELGYFELEDAETQAQGKGEKKLIVRNALAYKPVKSELDKLREEYPEIVEYIDEYGDEYGVGKKALTAFCEEEYGEDFSVADFKEMGLIYTGKNKREDGTPSERFMLP